MATNNELHLIGAVIRTGNIAGAIEAGIDSTMFHSHRKEWRWVTSFFERYGRTPTVQAFKAKFGMNPPATTDISHFCDAVKETHIRHVLLSLMDKGTDAIDTGDDLIGAVQQMAGEMWNLMSAVGDVSAHDVGQDWSSVFDEIERRVERVKTLGIAGVPCGFPTIDSLLGGWQPARYVILLARLGVGKSWVAARMAVEAAMTGHTVVLNSLEQPAGQVAMRLFSILRFMAKSKTYTFTTSDMDLGTVDLDELKQFLSKEMGGLLPGRIIINDTRRGAVTPMTLAIQAEKYKPDLQIVDYIGLMQRDGIDHTGYEKLSADLKLLCERYQAPIVAIAQANREAVGRGTPGPENIAGADAIGRDADHVLSLSKRSDHVLSMEIAKNRHGIAGRVIPLHFDANNGCVEEVTAKQADAIKERDNEARDDA